MLYADASAFLKLVVPEEHSAVLRFAVADSALWASKLLEVEVRRAARRLDMATAIVDEAMEGVTLLMPTSTTFATACTLAPVPLRAADALHLAAALELGADLDGMLTYDRRLAAGCEIAGVAVVAPGLADGWWR